MKEVMSSMPSDQSTKIALDDLTAHTRNVGGVRRSPTQVLTRVTRGQHAEK